MTNPAHSSWTIRYGSVRPADLSVGWESMPDGSIYTWTQAPLVDETLTGTNETYTDAIIRTINELKSLPPAAPGMVRVASATVSEPGAWNFISTTTSPVHETIESMSMHLAYIGSETAKSPS